jgi:multicomponent Na+:H+ antiporter subunit G
MSVPDIVVAVLVGAGVVITVLATMAALVARSVYLRLHYLTVITSLAVPLAGVGLIVANGIGLTAASVLLIVVLQAVTGPVLGAAIARANAQQDKVIDPERSPQ